MEKFTGTESFRISIEGWVGNLPIEYTYDYGTGDSYIPIGIKWYVVGTNKIWYTPIDELYKFTDGDIQLWVMHILSDLRNSIISWKKLEPTGWMIPYFDNFDKYIKYE